VAVAPNGDVIATGWFSTSIDLGGGRLQNFEATGYVARFTNKLHHLWSKGLGGSSYNGPAQAAVDAQGDVLVTGWFGGEEDFGGGVLKVSGDSDVFLVKYSAAGEHVWSRGFGTSYWSGGTGVAIDSDRNVVIVGGFDRPIDFGGGSIESGCGIPPPPKGCRAIFVAKFSPDGAHQWSRRVAATDYGLFRANVIVDDANDIRVVGSFAGSNDFGGGPVTSVGGSDVFIAVYSPSGAFVSLRQLGGPGDDFGGHAVFSPCSGAMFSGTFVDQLDVEQGVDLTSRGDSDVYLLTAP
jgi:hypothetical protein